MKNIFLALEGGSVEQQKKKKATVYAILITAAALALTLFIFLITGVISLVSNSIGTKPDKDSDSTNGYISTTFTEDQKNGGSLLLVDDNHPYRGNNIIMLIASATNRPKNSDGSWAYTIGGTNTLGGTEEAITSFNEMLADFYAVSGDDNIYINSAHHNASTSQAEIYRSGLCFELTYYYNFYANSQNRPSIYGVEKYAWLYQNAHKYGFIQLFPVTPSEDGSVDTTKANIFRYVGVPHATYIKDQNITLEQYLEYLKTKTADNALTISANGTSYKVYYVADGAEALVPPTDSYTVDGDNLGGYIITVKLS